MKQQVALLCLLFAFTSGGLVKRDVLENIQNVLSDGLTWAQQTNDVPSTWGCLQKAVDQFGPLDWADRLKFEDDSLVEAPMSFACFVQCWYEIDDQSDMTTGLPSSKAIRDSAHLHTDRDQWVETLATAVGNCDADLSKLATPKIVDDTHASLTPKDINKDNRCVNSLRIDKCANKFFTPASSDKGSYRPVTTHHDLLVAVANMKQMYSDVGEEVQSKFVQPAEPTVVEPAVEP